MSVRRDNPLSIDHKTCANYLWEQRRIRALASDRKGDDAAANS